jgi:hypothetical protein
MRLILFSLTLLLLSNSIIGQTCHCPVGVSFCDKDKPLKVFSFSNKKSLAICGQFEVKNKDTTYEEFACLECGQKKIIDQWGATEQCKIVRVNDTLFITELYSLPIGKSFKDVVKPFHVYKFYYHDNKIKEECCYRKDIPLYSAEQNKQVIQRFYKLKKGNSDANLDEAFMLFWAFVSGSKEAEKCFNEMYKKYGPFDGAIVEQWNFIYNTYLDYKSQRHIVKHFPFNNPY